MSKNWKKLFIGLMLCVGMTAWTSCSSDDTPDKGNGIGNEVTETGLFSINLRGGIMTRVAASETEEGSSLEQLVSNVWVGLYDKTTHLLAYSWHLTASNVDGNTPFEGEHVVNTSSGANQNNASIHPTNSRFIMTAREVLKKPYDMVVLANYTEVIDQTTLEVGTHFSDLQASIKKEVEELTTYNQKGDNIFMSNARGLIPVKESDIYETAAEAETTEKAVPVEIDRAVAKISLSFSETLIERNGTVNKDGAKWAIDIINKHLYPIRKQTNTSYGTMETPARVENLTNRFDIYAEDPNFDGISNRVNGQNNLSDEFTYTTNINLDMGSFDYVTENTMAAEEQWEDVTTRVVAKINFIPTGTGSTIGANTSYYFFKGYAIAQLDMDKIVEGTAVIPNVLTGIKDVVEEITTTPSLSKYNLEGNATESWTYNGLSFYRDGISYYSILIRHFNDSQQSTAMGYGRYGVVRNNVYKISINSISGPGSIEIPKPEGKDDKNTGWISADITVQPWFIRNQVADL